MKGKGSKILVCHICEKIDFSSRYKLNAHLYQSHKAIPPRFHCKYCSKEYYRTDQFKIHLESHTNKRKLHYCDYCGRGFVDKRNLINHLHVHEDTFNYNVSRYKCEACDVTYCEERLLKYHIRKEHLNLKEIKPAYLQKAVNDTWIENITDSKNCVQITKVNDNKLSIKKCEDMKKKKDYSNSGKETSLQLYLASSFASDDNQYSKAICDYCNKAMLKKSLASHITLIHLKLRRFKCDDCKRDFQRHYQMVAHRCGQGRKRKTRLA